ncbi:dienelactone hydrolase family protein [Haladaptatus sp. DFWS20]|uniref:dienelactone hydrolase family protein n=1 Tax=Haladaptatus sp. DFWS20 TaxID=3403467 RepID=UPI003EBFA53E
MQSGEITIPVDGVQLEGNLEIPQGATGLVLFAHGSGSSRKSPRNNFVAERLRDFGLGTLLFDLLTEDEDSVYENRFDIGLLTDRLVSVTEWVKTRTEKSDYPLGYFGSSTGAAAALRAAARYPAVGAVVSRGGRVDLATAVLDEVSAPTLFIVGGQDTQVLELNREAHAQLTCEKELEIVDGAGHLFSESGVLETVANLTGEWFASKLSLRKE